MIAPMKEGQSMLATQLHHLFVSIAEIHCRCQDYILIDSGVGRTTEICGNISANSVFTLGTRNFTVYFRSSETINHKGFEMYIVCFRPNETDQPGDYHRACHFIP